MTPLGDDDIKRVLDAAEYLRGVAFHDYGLTAISTGISARLVATRSPAVDAYVKTLVTDPAEITALLDALLVPHTTFFRDAGVFAAIARTVIPALSAELSAGSPLRAWSIGASSGEETWSLAMLLAASGVQFDLLGTDANDSVLSTARVAAYSPRVCDGIPVALRQRFVHEVGGQLVIAPELREHVRFAVHDMLGARIAPSEAIIASFDLVMLRNVLIYFDRRLQLKALERVAEVLTPRGVLVLGKYETLPDELATRLRPFAGLDPRLRVYQSWAA